jgi:chromosome condensin MukBEF ATPase and DNA-binding subunit MukB
MHEDINPDKLRANLNERLKSLHDLYSGELISMNTLSSQLLELIAAREAKTFWDLTMKKDITARRMLTMLEDPERWEADSSSPEDERKRILKERLAGVFLSSEGSYEDILEMLLDTASLPHFESLVFSRNGKPSGKKSGAKLSVLD